MGKSGSSSNRKWANGKAVMQQLPLGHALGSTSMRGTGTLIVFEIHRSSNHVFLTLTL